MELSCNRVFEVGGFPIVSIDGSVVSDLPRCSCGSYINSENPLAVLKFSYEEGYKEVVKLPFSGCMCCFLEKYPSFNDRVTSGT